MKNKKLLMIVLVIAALLLMSGCSIPTDEAGHYIQITNDTTFKMMMENEGWFQALFVFPISKAINYLTPLFNPNYGVALSIAIVTIGINLVLLLFTFKSQVATQRMQEMQPEMNKIQKKYEGRDDDASKMKMAQEMQNLYKKYDINPFGAMFSQFLQFPLIIAVYQAVYRAQSVTTGSVFGLSLELSPLDGITNGQWGFIVIFIIMVICQFVQVKLPTYLGELAAKKDAEKHHKRYEKTKNPSGIMMYSMVAVISVLAFTWPTAMSIYWIISSLVMILKTLLIKFVFTKKSN